MTHRRVKSSNIHSLAHQGTTLEARFNCPKCAGKGSIQTTDFAGKQQDNQCGACNGNGHTGTHVYQGVPAAVHQKVLGAPSVGKAFNLLVRGNYKFTKPSG